MPERIQLSRAKGWRMPENTVKVDRTSKFGNPFKATDVYVAGLASKSAGMKPGDPIGQAGAVSAFRRVIESDLKHGPRARKLLDELRGKNLACWCKLGTPCHADVLLELANSPEAGITDSGTARDSGEAPHD